MLSPMRSLLVACLVLSACDGDPAHPRLKPFPTTFLWGTATAPYQVEGGLHDSDWYQWESTTANEPMQHADDGPESFEVEAAFLKRYLERAEA